MNNSNSNAGDHGHNRQTIKIGIAAALVIASMTLTSTQVLAAPTCFSTPIPVPATTSGIYINLFNGMTGAAAATTGWDFNPWGSSNASFWVATTTPATGFVGVGGVIANLANGTMVDGTSTYLGNGTATTMATYRAGVTNGNLGMRFVEAGNTYYAWVNVTTTGPTTGLPVTINNWCFENTPDTGIMVGTTPVSLQTFTID